MRVRRLVEFQAAYERKCKASDGTLLLFAQWNLCGCTRLGLSVSRRRGNAVKRNQQKRRLREAFRIVQHELPVGIDLIAIPIHVGPPSLTVYQDSIRKLAKKLDRRLRETVPNKPESPNKPQSPNMPGAANTSDSQP